MYLNSLTARMLAAFALTAPVSASVIIDLEPNDSLAGAQNIDGSFSTGANGDIGPDPTLIPWVSISGTGNDTFDYYSFTVQNIGDIGTFDIDDGHFSAGAGTSIDTVIAIWDSTGTLIAENDDSAATDPGSATNLDSFLQITFTSTGLFVVGVSEADNTPQATNGGWDPALAEPIQSTGTYDLQVSLQPVPEPTTFLSVLMAFGWFAVGRRSRQR